MQRLALSCLSALLLVSLAACDKSKDAKSDDKKADDKKADAKPADAKPADAEPADAKPANTPPADPNYVDDTKGLGMIVREVAVDTGAAQVDASKVPTYDTSKDEGGLVGHIATALAHDAELQEAATTKELLKLAGEEGNPGPTDEAICEHVWTNIFSKAYPTKTDADDTFTDACTVEVERARLKLGSEIFAQHTACVLAATELGALDLCDAAEQAAELWQHTNPSPDKPEATLCTAAVEHMFILVSRDIGDDADMLELLEEDIYGIKDDAKLICPDEAKKAELDCIMKAAKLADLETCRAPAP